MTANEFENFCISYIDNHKLTHAALKHHLDAINWDIWFSLSWDYRKIICRLYMMHLLNDPAFLEQTAHELNMDPWDLELTAFDTTHEE